jgi:hypothetical protein
MTTYVIETFRSLGRAGNLRVFQGCRAKVSDKPVDYDAREKSYTPEEWRALLSGPDVMYRHKDDREFRSPNV